MRIEKSCIAIDVGGTKMLIAEVMDNGTICDIKRIPTGRLNQRQLIGLMTQGVLDYEKEIGWQSGKRPESMGIGIVGLIDPVKGIWHKIDQEFAEELPLTDIMKRCFNLECYIDNDVKSATIAEGVYGAGKGISEFIYINVGTGLAAGMVAGGKLVRGRDGYAGEIGYMDFNMGKGPHLESIASGVGLNRRMKELLPEYPDSHLNQHINEIISGHQVFCYADQGDLLAKRLLDDIVFIIAQLINNLTCAFSPEKVVLGGGLVSNGILIERIRQEVKPSVYSHMSGGIVLSELDPAYTGLVGAAAVGFGNQKNYF